MTKENIREGELLLKMLEHTLKLYFRADRDKLICGDAFVEFGERELRIIEPTTIRHKVKTTTPEK